MVQEHSISEKVKERLTRKLEDCRQELIKLSVIKRELIFYASTVVSSIIILTSLASLRCFYLIEEYVVAITNY